METIDTVWVCQKWREAETKEDWDKLNWQFQGAGMAIYGKDSQAGIDYWFLSDLATEHYLGELG